jgi:hypothetical protein
VVHDAIRARRRATAASAVVLVVEAVGTFLMWAPIPAVWFWVGARVFEATGSFTVDGLVVLAGLIGSIVLLLRGLTRIDGVWITLRREAGHDQRDGALNQVVVASATLSLTAFWVWFHIMEKAFIIPFMPQG